VNLREYLIFKPRLQAQGHAPIISRPTGKQGDPHGGKWSPADPWNPPRADVPVADVEKSSAVMPAETKAETAWPAGLPNRAALQSASTGARHPMDIEWAKDASVAELFVVQARPETVKSRQSVGRCCAAGIFEAHERPNWNSAGRAIGASVSSGPGPE